MASGIFIFSCPTPRGKRTIRDFQNTQFQASLGSSCEQLDGDIVGSRAGGLPVNIIIEGIIAFNHASIFWARGLFDSWDGIVSISSTCAFLPLAQIRLSLVNTLTTCIAGIVAVRSKLSLERCEKPPRTGVINCRTAARVVWGQMFAPWIGVRWISMALYHQSTRTRAVIECVFRPKQCVGMLHTE